MAKEYTPVFGLGDNTYLRLRMLMLVHCSLQPATVTEKEEKEKKEKPTFPHKYVGINTIQGRGRVGCPGKNYHVDQSTQLNEL